MAELSDRLQQLVAAVNGGSMREGARHTGIKTPTFAEILSGKAKNPRRDSLEKIARAYDVSLDWLTTGNGAGPVEQNPANELPQVEMYQYFRLRDRIGQGDDALRSKLDSIALVPLHVVAASPFQPSAHNARGLEMRAEMREAVRDALRFWLRWLNTVIDVWGLEALQQWLRSLSDDDWQKGFREPPKRHPKPLDVPPRAAKAPAKQARRPRGK